MSKGPVAWLAEKILILCATEKVARGLTDTQVARALRGVLAEVEEADAAGISPPAGASPDPTGVPALQPPEGGGPEGSKGGEAPDPFAGLMLLARVKGPAGGFMEAIDRAQEALDAWDAAKVEEAATMEDADAFRERWLAAPERKP